VPKRIHDHFSNPTYWVLIVYPGGTGSTTPGAPGKGNSGTSEGAVGKPVGMGMAQLLKLWKWGVTHKNKINTLQ
jgi:hypothetical protein